LTKNGSDKRTLWENNGNRNKNKNSFNERTLGMRETTEQEFKNEAERRFGKDPMLWAWKCPVCGFVQTAADYKAAGAPESAVGYSCVGRWIDGSRRAFGGKGVGPCDYTGGGLFALNPVAVLMDNGRTVDLFELATEEEAGF